MSQGERRLAAIMFTDIVGYTALTQADESQALEVLERHNRLLKPIFPKYHGREVKAIGDSFLVEFDSALDATNCAVQIQRFLHDYNISSRDEWKITLRIGIHLGDVVHNGNDILGDAVNIASRLQPLADSEGICVSDQVFGQVRNKVSQTLEKMEPQDLKGVRFPVEIYRVVMPWSAEPISQPVPSEKKRIAVLPFTNLSSNPEEGYFADGMTEELITSLSGVRQLTVIARTSVMGYKGTTKKVKEIARELDVGSMLEGSVRKAGNRVRITAQLIDTATEGHLWAQNYDRELDDVFVVQSEIAEKVAGELKVQLLDSEKRTLEEKPTENMEAYTLYMKGKQLLGESTEANLRAALAHFTRATEIDPKFAKAYAGIAQTWFSLGGNGYEDFSLMAPKITAAARKSLELGPDFAEAHLAMGLMYMNQDLHEDQRAEIERAIQLNPNLAEAYPVLGSSQMVLSRLEDAIGSYENRYKLDPLSIDAAVSLSQVYLFAARQDESFALLQKVLQLHPRNPTVYLWGFSYYYMYHGDYFKAQESIDRAKELGGEQFDVKWAQGLLDALMGKNERVAEQIEYFKGMKDESTGVVGVFVLASVIGDLDEAFKNLMRMAELHSWPPFIKYSRYFTQLRADPRYIEFCKKVSMAP